MAVARELTVALAALVAELQLFVLFRRPFIRLQSQTWPVSTSYVRARRMDMGAPIVGNGWCTEMMTVDLGGSRGWQRIIVWIRRMRRRGYG